jgi:predicted transcriptional regulator
VKKKTSNTVVIYQARNGAIELHGDFSHETVWATLDQIADVFGRDKSVISRRLKNVFEEGELSRSSVVAKNATTATDGKTYQVDYYNLDAIISVGYRVNSKTATQFRQWATKTLRGYILNGYAVNKSRIAKNYSQFTSVVNDIKKLLPKGSAVDSTDAVELISLFADTWHSLDAYDRELPPKGKLTKKKVALTGGKISKDLSLLREELIRKGEATDIFGNERTHGSVSNWVAVVGFAGCGGRSAKCTATSK